MKTNRAYSTLEVKALDDEKRVITGIASTPSPDRMQDVVEPKGAQFKLPIPFLWQHNHDEPIGHVTEAKVTQKGIEVSVQLTQVEEPGKLKDRLDEAWQSIKSGLVRGLSIGFSAKEFEQIPGSWGLRFLSWEWFELSAVTIPANAEATITSVKSIDREQRAALGIKSVPVVRVTPAGASAIKTKTIKVPKPQEGNDMKTTAEQIAEFEATRVTKAAEMEAIMTKAAEAGETLDAEQSEQFDTLEAEIAAIDKHIGRLKQMQKAQAANAKPVTEEAGAQRMANVKALDFKEVQVRAKNTQKLEPGIAFARAAKALAIGHVNHLNAIDVAKSMYEGQENIIGAVQRAVIKAAVPAGTTSHSTWAGPLVGDESSVFADFVEFLRPLTILGRFGQGNVPSLRRVPFRTRLVGQTSGGAGYWVGEGQAKPLTKFDFAGKTLEPLKVANIAVITKELLRDSSPAADVIIRDQLAAALSERQDLDFIDPAKAASAGISPASILNGIVGIPSSGTDADAVRADVKAVFSAFIAANNAPTSGVWVMDAITALSLSLMKNALGQNEFPGITMNGGIFEGLPAIVSQYVPRDSGGGIVALVNAGDIYIADDGGVDISMSTEASLQMDNAPTNNSTTPTATQLVSLWQTNSVGFLAERTVNWDRRRDSAAAYLTDVNWG
ncbi:phage capsid protein [Pseudomonas aeruginosa]|uniref:phage major capsid protein n=1 Tax=Pseudomonas aeruginosa TaxID=287 RepID=UPI00071B333A|nr:phage major capsid protein [Pseudomonas aeruginosa]KSR43097.1 phage capsid protein [Pseudomonas aeruginosa]RPV08061.1 phage major capsid protein [Pseudomonas aeruginosa]